jgi:hypothetical protein
MEKLEVREEDIIKSEPILIGGPDKGSFFATKFGEKLMDIVAVIAILGAILVLGFAINK